VVHTCAPFSVDILGRKIGHEKFTGKIPI